MQAAATTFSKTLLILLTGLLMADNARSDDPTKPAAAAPTRVLRHVVLLKFKPEATADQIKTIEEAFCALPKKIDTITDFEWGTDVAPEKRSEGFTHCFLVTFADEASRASGCRMSSRASRSRHAMGCDLHEMNGGVSWKETAFNCAQYYNLRMAEGTTQ